METRDLTTRRVVAPDIVRLWVIGGTNNLARWLELLASGLFTYELTHSGLMVAGVTAARTLPMLMFGAFAGVLSEAIDRKRIMQTGMVITAITSAVIFVLAGAGLARPWHIAASNFICGTIWSAEMSSRRRMVGDSAAPGMLSRVIAVDSLAGASTRMIGPLVGSVVYDLVGLPGAYAMTLLLSMLNFSLAWPLTHRQVSQRLILGTAARDLVDGVRTAVGIPQVAAVLAVTMAMNTFVFCYSALVAPIALTLFHVSNAEVGLLAAAESAGALLAGLLLARGIPRLPPRVLMIGGSALFAATLVIMPLIPSFTVACLILLVGGTGTAAFSNMQTMLVLNGAPPAMRSRLLGLITVCIGTGPLGQLLAGWLADTLGLRPAVEIVALVGLSLILAIGWIWRRAEREALIAEEG